MTSALIIMVHYGSVDVTVDCLKSVYSGKDAPPTLLINNSGDKSLKDKIKSFKYVTLINPEINLGFAGANNLGIKKALKDGVDFVILLNNDTLVPPDFFNKIINFADNNSAGLICPKIYFARGFEYHLKKYKESDRGNVIWYAGGIIDWDNIYAFHRGVDEVDKGQYDNVVDTDFATGCCLLIKKEVLTGIGLIDDNYFLYFEDVDYSVRSRQKGFYVKYFPRAFIWHKNAASSQGPGSKLHQYYQTRNRLYFGLKFASVRTKIALLRESIKHFMEGGIRRKAVVDYYFHNMKKARI